MHASVVFFFIPHPPLRPVGLVDGSGGGRVRQRRHDAGPEVREVQRRLDRLLAALVQRQGVPEPGAAPGEVVAVEIV